MKTERWTASLIIRQGDRPRLGAVAEYGDIQYGGGPRALQYGACGESLWVATSHNPGIVESD